MRDGISGWSCLMLLAVLLMPVIGLADEPVTVLIVYYSQTGNTEKMAHSVAAGVNSVAGAKAVLKTVDKVTDADVAAAGGIVLGSPTYWGNLASPMKTFLESNTFFAGKVGAAFSTGGLAAGGKEHVIISLLLGLLMKGAVVVGPIYDFGAFQSGAFGATALIGQPGEDVRQAALDDAKTLGARVATVALQLKQ